MALRVQGSQGAKEHNQFKWISLAIYDNGSSSLFGAVYWLHCRRGSSPQRAVARDAGEGVCYVHADWPKVRDICKTSAIQPQQQQGKGFGSEIYFAYRLCLCLLSLEQVLSCPGKLFAGSQSIWLRAGQAGSRLVGPGQATLSIVTGKLSNFVDSLAFNCDCQFTRQMRPRDETSSCRGDECQGHRGTGCVVAEKAGEGEAKRGRVCSAMPYCRAIK